MRIPVRHITDRDLAVPGEQSLAVPAEERPERPVEAESSLREARPGKEQPGRPADAELPRREGPPAGLEPAPQGDYQDLYLRAMAEMANYRQRVEARAQEQVEEERRRLLREFLEFADNLELALGHLDEPGLRQGVRQTWEGLRRFLEREGVEAVAARGQPFDPQVHEAVATVAHPGGAGRVVEEVQRGYRYRGKLLRPARVVVGRGDV